MKYGFAVAFVLPSFVVGACVSIADIDASKYQPECARQCTGNYSQCVSAPLAGPSQFAQCKQSLMLCLQTCPPK